MKADKYQTKLLTLSLTPWKPAKASSRQVAVLMSGGVDSSVAAHLLKEDGWEVLGVTMKIPVSCDRKKRSCCGVDAAFVCNQLNIPHYFVDVTTAFEELIIKPFRQAYAKGLTPNPCVDCNTLLKFSLVWDLIEKTFGISHLATGHYAQVVRTDNQIRLRRAKDKTKDQSYFIYGIPRERLAGFVLPVGGLTKNEVRSIAAELNLRVADKAESMELCFAGQGDYRATLTDDRVNQPGDITDMHGNKIATHKGIANYTLGQRRGVGFAGGKPLYVGKIDARTNTIALGTREQVSSSTVSARQLNTLIPEQLVPHNRLFAKIRSYGNPQPCTITRVRENSMTVEFDQPQFAPAPGQKLVLYDRDGNLIAGGTITLDV